jgi:hypothetical protein
MNTLMAIETQKKYGGISPLSGDFRQMEPCMTLPLFRGVPRVSSSFAPSIELRGMPPNIQYCTYYNRDRDSINTGLFDDYCRRTGGNNAL